MKTRYYTERKERYDTMAAKAASFSIAVLCIELLAWLAVIGRAF